MIEDLYLKSLYKYIRAFNSMGAWAPNVLFIFWILWFLLCLNVDWILILKISCSQEADFKEWKLVVQEIVRFLKADTTFMNTRPLRYSLVLDPSPDCLPQVSISIGKRNLRLRDAILSSYHHNEVSYKGCFFTFLFFSPNSEIGVNPLCCLEVEFFDNLFPWCFCIRCIEFFLYDRKTHRNPLRLAEVVKS